MEGKPEQSKEREEKAVILDFLPNGYPFESTKTPVAQAVGTGQFTLLELIPKKEVFLSLHERVYIGEGKRDKILHIRGKLPFEKLTETAKSELKTVVEELVMENEERFVNFFNKSGPLSIRMHSLELLPGLGKKHMEQILGERKKEPFKSFEDIKKRISTLPQPKNLFVKKILQELEGKEKHNLFVRV